ncbi:heat shock factor binding protein 1-domain-containing protein, partial [Dichomitus squalens]
MAPPTQSSPALPLNVAPASRPQTAQSTLSTASSTTVGANKSTTNTHAPDISSPHELTAFVESLLEQLDQKFDDMSSQILDRMTQMSSRVDALEASIQDIISSDAPPPLPPSLPQSP